MKKLSQRRVLKKRLADAKRYRAALPRLIDCSQVYGDYVFTDVDYAIADADIADLEKQLAELPVHPDTIRQQQTNIR